MFLVKVVARPDARMVEVPLEIEAELPRDFDGTALLATSGMPRRVKLKAPKDALKLSTAYRTDQLLADLVRSALRGTPEDAARVQEAALGFLRGVRERRSDGATLVIRSDGSGRIDLSATAPATDGKPGGANPSVRTAAAGAGARPAAGPRADVGPAQGSLSDRLAALERRVAQLESGASRRAAADPAHPAAASGPTLSSPPPGGAAREGPAGSVNPAAAGKAGAGRGVLRRGTAVDAFSDGLRKELSGRATQLLGAADRAAAACDQATLLAAEAVRDLGAPPLGSEGDALRRLATEAAARQRALQRFLDEVDLYAPAELLMAERLLQRLASPGQEGSAPPDPAGPLSSLGEQLLRDGRGSELLGVWVARAAPLCRWTLIEPRAGDPLFPAQHEAKDAPAEGAIIARLLVPGVLRPDGSVLARARVSLEGDSAEAAEWAKALREPLPPQPAAAAPSEFAVSDEDVEQVEDLPTPGAAPDAPSAGSTPDAASAGARPDAADAGATSPQQPSGKPWED